MRFGHGLFTQYQSTFPDTGSSSAPSNQTYSFKASTYPSTSASTGQITSGTICPVGNPTHVTSSGGSKVVSVNLGTAGSALVDAFSSYNTSSTGCPVCHSVSPDGITLVTTGNLWQLWGGGGGNDVGLNQIQSGGTLVPIADPPQYSFPWDSTTWAGAASGTATNFPVNGSSNAPIEDSRAWPYAAISPNGQYILQGPNSWGNTRDDISTNNAQDGSYSTSSAVAYMPSPAVTSGDKSFFLMDTTKYGAVSSWNSSSPTTSFDPSLDYATDAPLPNAYTGTATTLTSNTAVTLSMPCTNITSNITFSTTGKTLLVKNETGSNAKYNGVYSVTQTSPWKLTRTTATATTGQLVYDQRFRVDSGKSLGSNPGSVSVSGSAAFPIYYRVTSPNPITIGTSAINFALWTTVRAATTSALGGTLSGNVLTAATPYAAFPSTIDGVPIVLGDTTSGILLKDQANPTQNGVYTLTTQGTGSAPWVLTRRTDYDGNSVALGTTAALPTTPVLSGTTLTAGSNAALIINVQNQPSSTPNGTYTITSLGSTTTPWSLSYCSGCSSSVATIANLPSNTVSSSLSATSNGSFVINVNNLNSIQNGYYTVTTPGSATSTWQLSSCSTCSSAAAATTAALPNTPLTFAAGLTATTNGALVVKVQNQTSTNQNGYYTVTNWGSGSAAWTMAGCPTCSSATIATTAQLPTSTFTGTLAGSTNGALVVQLSHQTSNATWNQCYTVTSWGSASTKWSIRAASRALGSLFRIRLTACPTVQRTLPAPKYWLPRPTAIWS